MRLPTALSLVWLLFLLGLVACAPLRSGSGGGGDDDDSSDDDDDSVDDDDDDDDDVPCAGILAVDPEQDATGVYGQRVSVTWDAVPVGGGVRLTDPASNDVPGSMSDDDNGRTLVFTADAALLADSTFEVTITQDCTDDVTYPFTTGPYGAPVQDEDDLIDRAFHIDLGGAEFLEPPGVGALLQGFLVDIYLLFEVTADSDLPAGVMHVLGATGALDGGDIVQDMTAETLPFTQGPDGVAGTDDDEPATWNDPSMDLQAGELVLSIQGVDTTIQDLAITATFHPQLTGFVGGTFGGMIDTRGLVGLLDSEDPNAICDLIEETVGVSCEDCGGGEVYCMTILAEDVTGTWLSNLPGGLTPVP